MYSKLDISFRNSMPRYINVLENWPCSTAELSVYFFASLTDEVIGSSPRRLSTNVARVKYISRIYLLPFIRKKKILTAFEFINSLSRAVEFPDEKDLRGEENKNTGRTEKRKTERARERSLFSHNPFSNILLISRFP